MAGGGSQTACFVGRKKRWKEAEGTYEGSSHEEPSWNGQSQPEAHSLTQARYGVSLR